MAARRILEQTDAGLSRLGGGLTFYSDSLYKFSYTKNLPFGKRILNGELSA